jgi:hypothetical protein
MCSNASYAALGLMHNLNPTTSGGTEIDINHPHVHAPPSTTAPAEAIINGLPRGFGRIIRDTAGNVIDVEMPADDEDAEVSEAVNAEEEWRGIGLESDWVKTLTRPDREDESTSTVVPGNSIC